MQAVYFPGEFTPAIHGDAATYGMDGLILDSRVTAPFSYFDQKLEIGTMVLRIHSTLLAGGAGRDWLALTPGTALTLDFGNAAPGGYAYYPTSVRQVSRTTVEITATDQIGLLDAMPEHVGGIYGVGLATTVETLVQEIFDGVAYAAAVEVSTQGGLASQRVYGHLPRDKRRNNLLRLLSATGAVMTRRASAGTYWITYPSGGNFQPSVIQPGVTYIGGSVEAVTPATSVQVTEHGFYQTANDEETTLFDNTAEAMPADHELVVFDAPVYGLAVTGTLTINESSANHAVVTGTGTLTGKEYAHTTKVVTLATGASGQPKVVRLQDNELVTYRNSLNVARRMAGYYGLDTRAKVSFYDRYGGGGVWLGAPVTFVDANGNTRTGTVERQEFAVGHKTVEDISAIVDFAPGPFGENLYGFELVTGEAATWTVPAGVTRVTAVLGSGGNGGQGGMPGANGDDGGGPDTDPKGGAGGSGGAAGSAGKILQVTLNVSPGTVISVSPGTGGSAGAAGGGAGGTGTATTITVGGTTYSSASGTVQADGYLDPHTGHYYGLAGENGIAGGDGGDEVGAGEDAVRDAELYAGGAAGVTENHQAGTNGTYIMRGGGGSGAAYGYDGNKGGDRYWHSVYEYKGGNGADAPEPKHLPGIATLASGGDGGNGGAGGGAGGGAWHRLHGHDYIETYGEAGEGGSGSAGTPGKAGGAGFALFIWTA